MPRPVLEIRPRSLGRIVHIPMVIGIVVVTCLVGPTAANGQVIPVVGKPATLDVATWNLEQFGNNGGPSDDGLQLRNAAAVITQSGIDLWSLQEIDSATALAALMTELGSDWTSYLSQSSNLHTAFVFRKDAFRVRQVQTILAANASSFAGRPPLMADLDVLLPDTTVRVLFVSLHMKCCSSATEYRQREAAAAALKTHLDLLYDSLPIVVLGDFNDELGRSITPGFDSPYKSFVLDSANYRFATQEMDDDGIATWCGNSSTCSTGSTIDHILVSNELFDALSAGATMRFDMLLSAISRYTVTTSDHLPVVARFGFGSATGTETLPTRVATGPVIDAWPIPASYEVRVRVRTPDHHRGPYAYTIFDVIGRVVQVGRLEHSDADGSAGIDLSALRTGFYFISATGSDGVVTRPLPVRR